MRIKIHSDAEEDLMAGHDFYEDRCPGLGMEFLVCLDSEIKKLKQTFRIHPKVNRKYHRAVVQRRFPYAIYYTFDEDCIYIRMIFDCRQDPENVARRLR